jgi:hypothetical protein
VCVKGLLKCAKETRKLNVDAEVRHGRRPINPSGMQLKKIAWTTKDVGINNIPRALAEETAQASYKHLV